jgi:hypothetical protein
MAPREGLLRGLQPVGLAGAWLAVRGAVVEPAFCPSAVRIGRVERSMA